MQALKTVDLDNSEKESVNYLLTVSIVSHMQLGFVKHLLADIAKFCDPSFLEVIVTINVHEKKDILPEDYLFNLTVIRNRSPKGFGANHNYAFSIARGDYFCVINPDIRLNGDPFLGLIRGLSDKSVGVIASLVLRENGCFADSAREFPSIPLLVRRIVYKTRQSDYLIGSRPIQPDWIAGMFMLFPSSVFKTLEGFDERYFLYCEDIDICARLYLKGLKCVLDPRVRIMHLEQRDSHYQLRYLIYHLSSIVRFFLSTVYWKLLFRKCSFKH